MTSAIKYGYPQIFEFIIASKSLRRHLRRCKYVWTEVVSIQLGQCCTRGKERSKVTSVHEIEGDPRQSSRVVHTWQEPTGAWRAVDHIKKRSQPVKESKREENEMISLTAQGVSRDRQCQMPRQINFQSVDGRVDIGKKATQQGLNRVSFTKPRLDHEEQVVGLEIWHD